MRVLKARTTVGAADKQLVAELKSDDSQDDSQHRGCLPPAADLGGLARIAFELARMAANVREY